MPTAAPWPQRCLAGQRGWATARHGRPGLAAGRRNDYIINLGPFTAGEQENIDFDVLGGVVGDQFVKAWVDGGVAPSDHDEDTLAIQVVKSADLSLSKTVNCRRSTPVAL
jgi:hypothetical protein